MLITGAVGSGPGMEFAHWLDNLDLPDPHWILDHPKKFTVPDRHDKVYAVVNGVRAAYLGSPSVDRWIAFGVVLQAVAEAGSTDLAVVAARDWAGDTKRAAAGAEQVDTAVFAAFLPILREMGVFGVKRRRAS